MNNASEEKIKQNITEQLAWNDSVKAENVKVEVSNNIIRLKGTVPGYSAKISAARYALQMAPGYKLENELEVQMTPEEPVVTDTIIVDNIQNALKNNSNINPLNVRVESVEGNVNLTGAVASRWERSIAEQVASSVRGVKDVKCKIEVRPAAVRSDEYIRKDLERAFDRNPLIDPDVISVDVKKGVVYLSGSVVNGVIMNEIVDNAVYTNGVVDVVNDITIIGT